MTANAGTKNADKPENRVYSVPAEIDKEIARIKLEAMGVTIATPTPEQAKYLASWGKAPNQWPVGSDQ